MANHPLITQLQQMRDLATKLRASNSSLARNLDAKLIQENQGIVPTTGARSLQENMRRALPNSIVPGNVGDMNKIVWPFWFTAQTPELPPAVGGTATQSTSSFTVTQEAAFILTDITKAVFIHTTPAPGNDQFTYVDAAGSGATPKTPGLTAVFQDAQSSRVFMNRPMSFDSLGYAQFPTEMPAPQLFLPNSVVQVQLFNNNPTNAYIPWLTFFGVRCRVEDAQEILSLVYA